MTRIWTDFMRLTGLAPSTVQSESALAEGLPTVMAWDGVRIERTRSHPHLLEVWTDAPTSVRTRFLVVADSDRQVIAEMPRGLSSFLINLGQTTFEPLGIEWHSFGGVARRTALAAGDPLEPAIRCGTRIRLLWQAQEFPILRIAALRWVGDGSTARPLSLGPPRTVDSASQEWVLPDEWLGPDPVELRLTPLAGDRQGLTERLILPPRRSRVETIFQRVMLPVNGRSRRRLRVEVRVPSPLVPPQAIVVDWRPYDSGVNPALFRREWPTGATSVAVDLENISIRGDRVQVRFEPADGGDQPHAWFAADESGYGPPPPDVLLAEGAGPDHHQFEFTHAHAFPIGERANLLVGGDPLSVIPCFETTPEDGPAEGWPSTLLASYRELATNRTLWAELIKLQSAADRGVGEFARVPQFYLQYAHESELRAIARRRGLARSAFVVDQLEHAGADRDTDSNDQTLIAFWASANDDELDRWLGAIAAGASVARLRTFWFEQRWAEVDAHKVLECSYQLDRVREQPLKPLIAEVVPDSFLAFKLSRAIAQEGRLPGVAPREFDQIILRREMILTALADHWAWLLPSDAAARCRRITDQLRFEPAAAALELAALRRQPEPCRLKRAIWPVFMAERELGAGRLRHDHERELSLRTAADWCRTLLERRMVPAWPWYGLPPDGQGTGSLLELWESVRTQLPDVSAVSSPPPSSLPEALARLDEVVAELGDDHLRAVADGFRDHATALGLWIQ